MPLEIGSEWKLLFQGAESRIYEGEFKSKSAILKERFPKQYRLQELDQKLTKERIRAEIKAYNKLSTATKSDSQLIKVLPDILYSDDRHIILSRIENSITLKTFLADNCDHSQLIERALISLAKLVAHIHSIGLIHGDLTTSNFLIIRDEEKSFESCESLNMVPIDFGLSYMSKTDENRAVDLYVLERAIQSTHPGVNMEIFFEEYQKQMVTDSIIKRLNQVRMRGRKRMMIG